MKNILLNRQKAKKHTNLNFQKCFFQIEPSPPPAPKGHGWCRAPAGGILCCQTVPYLFVGQGVTKFAPPPLPAPHSALVGLFSLSVGFFY